MEKKNKNKNLVTSLEEVKKSRKKKSLKTLREIREEHGLTRAKLAEDCFIHPMSIYNYETGKSEPSITIAKILADYFGMNIYDIKW